jgi:hypothetical protein
MSARVKRLMPNASSIMCRNLLLYARVESHRVTTIECEIGDRRIHGPLIVPRMYPRYLGAPSEGVRESGAITRTPPVGIPNAASTVCKGARCYTFEARAGQMYNIWARNERARNERPEMLGRCEAHAKAPAR